MVKHVIDTANQLGAENVHLIYGHGGELMRERLANESVNWVFQSGTIGYRTCYATSNAFFRDDENVLMVYGDGPMITPETLQN